MKQAVRKIVEREPDIVKTTGQSRINVSEFTTSRGLVRSDQLIVGSTNLFVELNVGRAAQAAPMGVLVKNAADEERVISNVGAKEEGLLRCCPSERDQHIGDVFVRVIVDLLGRLQLVRARKSFEERADVIGKFPIADSGLLQDMSREDVKIKLGRNPEMSGVAENRLDQFWMIENRVQHFCVA